MQIIKKDGPGTSPRIAAADHDLNRTVLEPDCSTRKNRGCLMPRAPRCARSSECRRKPVTKKNSNERPLRVGLISLGCAKNLVDAEIMLGSLLKSGVEITNDAAQADAVIVNTCSFIDSAQEESVDTILESVELRDANQSRPGRDRFRLPAAALPRGTAQTACRKWTPSWALTRSRRSATSSAKAIGSRAEKVGKPESQKPEAESKKSSGALNELEKNRAASEHEKEESIRGTEKFGKTKTVVARIRRQSAIRIAGSGRHRAPGFHSRFRHAALPAHAETFCLRENRRGLQPSVQLLHHSPDARLASQPHAKRHRRRSQGAHRRRREGNQFDFAGLDLLRTGFAPEPQPRDFVAGKIFRRRQIAARRCHDHLHAAARIEFAPGDFGSACFTRIRRIGRTN
jgi:hypothetical protein